MKNKFLQEMQSRGYLNQCTDLDKLGEICNKKSISGYIGFDCTARSLHVGSLLPDYDFKINAKTWSSTYCSAWWWNDIDWRSVWQRLYKKNIKSK